MEARAMRRLASRVRCSTPPSPLRVGAVGIRSEAAAAAAVPMQVQPIRWKTSANINKQEVYQIASADPTLQKEKPDVLNQVKESMRLVAQTMAIITTPVEDSHAEEHSGPGRDRSNVIGLVASSFNVVTLNAPGGPIVSFNLKLPSRTFAAISERGQFEVSFPWSAEVSQWFLRPPPQSANADIIPDSQTVEADDRRGGGSGGSPRFSNHTAIASASRPEALLKLHRTFAYRCDWLQEQSIAIGDHMIMIGQVREVVLGDTIDAMCIQPERLPINYRDGKFLKLKNSHKQAAFFEYSSSVAEEIL